MAWKSRWTAWGSVALVVLAGARPAVPGVRDADVTTCVGMATYTAVGPYQAHARGALFSLTALYSILGGTVGTVAVKRGLLGLSKPQLREYGKKIFVFPQDSGMLTGMGGPRRPFTVSDFGDRDVQDARGERFDVYRWASRGRADEFGVRKFLTKITFPAASGGTCPPGWAVSP